MQVVKGLALAVFFPNRCVGCGRFGSVLCFECAGKIEKIRTPTCAECGRINRYGEFCQNCKSRLKIKLDGLIIAAQYEAGPLKAMIHQLKYESLGDLAPLLAELLVLRLRRHLPPGHLVVVPVPLFKKRECERGFNQSELMARYLSERLGFAGGLAIERVRETKPQVRLSSEKRRQNLRGAFRVCDPDLVAGATVLLVDDVATTLSTLNECALVLKLAGAKKVFGVVAARG